MSGKVKKKISPELSRLQAKILVKMLTPYEKAFVLLVAILAGYEPE